VPQIEVSEQQIVDALERLSPRGRREAVRRLIAGASIVDRMIDALQPRIVEVARQRGLDWTTLSDEERERLVDEILHE
jgi:DNA-binding PucR family transcriptional regulator